LKALQRLCALRSLASQKPMRATLRDSQPNSDLVVGQIPIFSNWSDPKGPRILIPGQINEADQCAGQPQRVSGTSTAVLRSSILPASTGRMVRAHLALTARRPYCFAAAAAFFVMHRLLAQRLAYLGLHCGFIHRSCPFTSLVKVAPAGTR